MQVRYRTLPRVMIDSMHIKPGDFIMEENAYQQARREVALQRSVVQTALGQLAAQKAKGRAYRASLDSIQQRMNQIVAEKDAEISRLNARYDSLTRNLNGQIEEVAVDLEIHYQQGDQLKEESFEAEMEALRSADELEKQVKKSDQAVGEWLKKKEELNRRNAAQPKRSGFLRELLYHPTTTPVGRVLVGGLVVSFTALTAVTIISLTK